jgi:hypothetical protein
MKLSEMIGAVGMQGVVALRTIAVAGHLQG